MRVESIESRNQRCVPVTQLSALASRPANEKICGGGEEKLSGKQRSTQRWKGPLFKGYMKGRNEKRFSQTLHF
jgi:ribosomal protein L2